MKDEDLNLVLQAEWVQLGSEKGENISSAKEEGSKGGEGGDGRGLFSGPDQVIKPSVEGRG